MKKRCLWVLTALILLVTLALPASAEEANVIDLADILSPQEKVELMISASEAGQRVGCGLYILTVDDYRDFGGGTIESILKEIYLENDYGLDSDRSGIILMLSMSNRKYALYTHGFGDEGLSGFAKDALVERFVDDFHDNLWYDGFQDYICTAEEYLTMTLEGEPLTEKTVTGFARTLGVTVCILLGLLIAWIVRSSLTAQMKSVEEKSQAVSFISKEGLQLSRRDDIFTHTTETRVYDPPKSDSGGSSGGSSSGSSRSGSF